MIERLGDMPPDTIGLRAAGEIERQDYDEVIVPALRQAVESGAGLRTLHVIEGIPDVARVFALDDIDAAKSWVADDVR
jgi:hypothetical protein